MSEPITVLHVDDEPPQLELTKSVLEEEGDIDVRTASSPRRALELLDGSVDCVLSDYQMPQMDGIEFFEAVRERRPSVPFVLFTGEGGEEIAGEAISAGVTAYVQKEAGIDRYAALAARVETLVDRCRAEPELEGQKRREDGDGRDAGGSAAGSRGSSGLDPVDPGGASDSAPGER